MKKNKKVLINKKEVSFFPPEKALTKICQEMSSPNYPRSNMALPKNATSLEKSKYSLCKEVLIYQQKHNLSVAKLAKQIDLTVPEVEDILFARINKFTLDRLTAYVANLFPAMELSMILPSKEKGHVRRVSV